MQVYGFGKEFAPEDMRSSWVESMTFEQWVAEMARGSAFEADEKRTKSVPVPDDQARFWEFDEEEERPAGVTGGQRS